MIHELKTWPGYFREVQAGRKNFEVRKNDRDFQVGDTLILNEYDIENDTSTGNRVIRTVTYILHGGAFGIQDGFVVMGLKAERATH